MFLRVAVLTGLLASATAFAPIASRTPMSNTALRATSAAADACRATFSTWFDPERNGRKLELRHVVGVDPLPTNLGDGVATFGANGKVSGEKQQSHNEERLVRYAPLCFPISCQPKIEHPRLSNRVDCN